MLVLVESPVDITSLDVRFAVLGPGGQGIRTAEWTPGQWFSDYDPWTRQAIADAPDLDGPGELWIEVPGHNAAMAMILA